MRLSLETTEVTAKCEEGAVAESVAVLAVCWAVCAALTPVV